MGVDGYRGGTPGMQIKERAEARAERAEIEAAQHRLFDTNAIKIENPEKSYYFDTIDPDGPHTKPDLIPGEVTELKMEGLLDGGQAGMTVIEPVSGGNGEFKLIVPGTQEGGVGYEQQVQQALAEGYSVATVNFDWSVIEGNDAVNYGTSMDALGSAVATAINTLTEEYGANEIDVMAHSMGWQAYQNAVLLKDNNGAYVVNDMSVINDQVIVGGADQIDLINGLSEGLEEMFVNRRIGKNDGDMTQAITGPPKHDIGSDEHLAQEQTNIANDRAYHEARIERQNAGYEETYQGTSGQYMHNFYEWRDEFEQGNTQQEFAARMNETQGTLLMASSKEDAVLGTGNLKEQHRAGFMDHLDEGKGRLVEVEGTRHGFHHEANSDASRMVNEAFIGGVPDHQVNQMLIAAAENPQNTAVAGDMNFLERTLAAFGFGERTQAPAQPAPVEQKYADNGPNLGIT